MRFGNFMAPFHPVGQNPTLAIERDLDLIVAMDRLNREVLLDLSPAAYRERVRLLMEFAGVPLDDGEQLDVPDPYYGGAVGFERVLDLVEQAADGLLAEIRARMRAH